MDEILKLTQEKSTWLFLADGLTQEHQQSVKLDILRKVDNLQSEINELKRAKADTSDELGDCNMPRVMVCCRNCGYEKEREIRIEDNYPDNTAKITTELCPKCNPGCACKDVCFFDKEGNKL